MSELHPSIIYVVVTDVAVRLKLASASTIYDYYCSGLEDTANETTKNY